MLSQPPFSYLDTLSKVDDCIDVNADLAEAILSSAASSIGLIKEKDQKEVPPWHNQATKLDLDKARSTVHQLVRDWSAEGAAEREACYGPVLQALGEEFQQGLQDGSRVDVLVPGAGLGRLVFEMCRQGYYAEGNEISYHQLLTSSFILNHTTQAEEWCLHPFALSFSNVRSRDDQLRSVLIPDVHPGSSLSAGRMGMTTGDFVQVYGGPENANRFDAVVTVFFLDTAPNVQTYIDTIRDCLKPGGVWINLGPLLWHFEGKRIEAGNDNITNSVAEPGSFEPSLAEVQLLIQRAGFVLQQWQTHSAETGYVQNKQSMLKSVYEPCRWVARKPRSTKLDPRI